MKLLNYFLIFVIIIGLIIYFFGLGSSEIVIENPSPKELFEIVIPEKKRDKDTVTMLALGDIMLGRYVETLTNKNGVHYPFENMSSVFSNFDVVFGNLEGSILEDHKQTHIESTRFSFASVSADVLASSSVDMVTLANNHSDDFGEDGYEQTRGYLQSRSIFSFGHPLRIEERSSISRKINGREFVFVGFNLVGVNFDNDKAVKHVEGVANEDNFVIVSVHWGDEYNLVSNGAQKELAHKLIDSGTDLIIGHHPHVTQEIEEYKGKIIFYSLGNFIFDQYFSRHVQQGLMPVIVLKDDEVSYYLIPVSGARSQPSFMGKEDSEAFLSDLADRSSASLLRSISEGVIKASLD